MPLLLMELIDVKSSPLGRTVLHRQLLWTQYCTLSSISSQKCAQGKLFEIVPRLERKLKGMKETATLNTITINYSCANLSCSLSLSLVLTVFLLSCFLTTGHSHSITTALLNMKIQLRFSSTINWKEFFCLIHIQCQACLLCPYFWFRH